MFGRYFLLDSSLSNHSFCRVYQVSQSKVTKQALLEGGSQALSLVHMIKLFEVCRFLLWNIIIISAQSSGLKEDMPTPLSCRSGFP